MKERMTRKSDAFGDEPCRPQSQYRRQLKRTGALLSVLTAMSAPALALTANEISCGPLHNAYGPFDYRDATPDKKQIVESVHFTSEVEQLIRGRTSATPVGDLDYTLRVFPNHPRALYSLMRWGQLKKTDYPKGAHWPIWCYFDRATRFQPEDAQVRMLYGMYLQKKGSNSEAMDQLAQAEKYADDSANVFYNIGLVYLDLNKPDKALEYAHRAYRIGFPLQGLRNRLERIGKWKPLLPAPAQ